MTHFRLEFVDNSRKAEHVKSDLVIQVVISENFERFLAAENRTQTNTYQNLCPDIDLFWPNVHSHPAPQHHRIRRHHYLHH